MDTDNWQCDGRCTTPTLSPEKNFVFSRSQFFLIWKINRQRFTSTRKILHAKCLNESNPDISVALISTKVWTRANYVEVTDLHTRHQYVISALVNRKNTVPQEFVQVEKYDHVIWWALTSTLRDLSFWSDSIQKIRRRQEVSFRQMIQIK